jgi:colanic acid/amylovoran biosynthesis glycosyltransferase
MAAGVDQLTVLHVTSQRFGLRHHPATWRTIVGLARHFRTVVLSGHDPGYFDGDDDAAAGQGRLGFSDASIHVQAGFDTQALADPAVARATATALRDRYGPIHAVVGHLSDGVRVRYLARRLGAPLLAFFHGKDATIEPRSSQLGANYERLRLAPGAFFLAVSGNLVASLLDFGMPRERTFLQHLGIDLASYAVAARAAHRREVRIVMAGRLRRQKGHELAIRGFAGLRRRFPEAELRFIGGPKGPEQRRVGEALVARVNALGLAASIHFVGSVPIEALRAEFAGADIALQTSVLDPESGRFEGLPNTILEAMASGLPVVATRHAGIPEAVRHERTGLLVDEHDADGLTAALARLAASPALRWQYGIAGRRVVEEEFDWIRQSDLMASRIRDMIRGYAVIDPILREAAWQACAPEGEAGTR